MGILIGIPLFIICLFFLLGWAIRYKKKYGLLSGFLNRSEEEQKQLIENRYPQKNGSLLMLTAAGMLMLLPLYFTPFLYTMEVQFGFMIVFLLGGFIYLSKYEVAKKRKRSYWLSSSILIVVLTFVSGIIFLGYQSYDLIVKRDTFTITGIYGDEWKVNDIKKIELMEEMPEVTWKENGFGMQTMAKGHFKVTGYGSSLLFIHKNNSSYLYIHVNDQHIFINGETSEQTRSWYEQFSSKD